MFKFEYDLFYNVDRIDVYRYLQNITFPPGVHNVAYAFPKVKIVTTAVDEEVNENFHILPGIGKCFSCKDWISYCALCFKNVSFSGKNCHFEGILITEILIDLERRVHKKQFAVETI